MSGSQRRMMDYTVIIRDAISDAYEEPEIRVAVTPDADILIAELGDADLHVVVRIVQRPVTDVTKS